MPQNFWENDPQVAPAQTRTGPQPVLTVPDTGKEQDRQRAEGADQRDQQRFEMQVEETGKRDTETRFNQEAKLRGEFDGNPEVKSYRSSLPMLNQALRAPKNGQGDISVIYAYAKLMDPTSVVRESEMDMVTSSSPWAQAKAQELQNQLDSSGRLPPQVRRNLEQEMIRTTAARRKAYDAQRNRYMKNAKAYGLDPLLVVGKHDGEAFRADAQAYDKERGLGRFAEGFGQTTAAPPGAGPGAISPQMRGGLPVGTEITFDGDSDPNAQWWDRDAWLMQNHGVTPDQEIQIASFWNANRRNPGLTVEGARGWYQQNGLPVPTDETLAMEVARAREGSGQYGAFDDSAAREAYRQRLEQINNQNAQVRGFGTEGYDPNSPLSYLDRLTEAPLLGGADELAGVAGGFVNLLSGQDPVQGYRTARDAAALRNQQMEQNQGAVGTGLEIIGSLPTAALGPAGEFGTVRQAVKSGLKAGAPVGAVAGFNEGRGIEGSLGGAVTGGAVGGAAGAGAAGAGKWAVDKLAARAAGAGMTPAQRYARGQEYGIDLSPGDAGGMSAKAMERTLDYQPGSATIMDNARQVKAGQIENAVGEVADTFGRPTTQRGIGEAAQRGARSYVSKSDEVAGRLYEAIPIAADAPAVTSNTVGRLRELTGKISSNPKLAAMVEDKRLAGYLEAIDEGGLSWNDLKQLRSRIGEEIGQQVLGEKTLKSDLRNLYSALSSDMEATAIQMGPDALKAFQRANTFYSQRAKRIDDVVAPLLGKAGDNTPEAAAALIQRISKGGKSTTDIKMLAQVRKTLGPDEWPQVQNGFIRQMGQPANSAGRDFQPQTFMRTFNDLDPAAKNILFGKGDLRKNLDEFAAVIDDIARNDGTRNTSNTANGVAGAIVLSPAVTGGFVTGGAPGAMAAILLQTAITSATAKVMTNPAAVRWLTGYSKMMRRAAQTGTVNPKAHASQMAALSRLAAAHPEIAQEATGLRQMLVDQFQRSAPGAQGALANNPLAAGQDEAKPTTNQGAQR